MIHTETNDFNSAIDFKISSQSDFPICPLGLLCLSNVGVAPPSSPFASINSPPASSS